ncbi:MAG: DegT/DnrJ/EryC1/StrS family aminotransferase [Nitrospinaceae bacterium]
MRLLLHSDYIIKTLLNEPPGPVPPFAERGHQTWILASALQDIFRQVAREGGGANAGKILDPWITQVSLLPLSGVDLTQALAAGGPHFPERVAALAVEKFQLDGVVTFNPEPFSALNITALHPRDILETKSGSPPPVTAVPLLDLPASFHEWLPEVEHALAEVTRSGRYILGPQVERLEKHLAAFCQSPFAVGVSSGTDALLISLMAAGIQPGDEVITTPFTFFATVGSIARMGAVPVMVDIDPVTCNMDPGRLEAALTRKTRALLPIHLYGQCADMDPVLDLARQRNLVVIEDAAQAIGADYKGRRAGSMGDYGCFSFFPTKNLGGLGDGGLVTTNSQENYERVKILRVHGSEPKYYHQHIGGNFRLDALQAAAVLAKSKYLEGWSQKRRDHAARYNESFAQAGLTSQLGLPEEVFPRHVYNQYVIRVPGGKRDALRAFLAKRGVGGEIYYPLPLHLQKCFLHLGYKAGAFPVSEQAAAEVLALPVSPEITPRQQDYVVENIQAFFKDA